MGQKTVDELSGCDEKQISRARFVPWGFVGLAVAWWLVALRGQLRTARTLNDSTFHMQMVRWAVNRWRDGGIALDGWFPDLTLGSSFFHHYQSLPYNITALASEILPSNADSTYRWILYTLIATWPISVYAACRIFKFDRWIAVSTAIIAPLLVSEPGYGLEFGSYLFGGFGVYTQLFGMWLLPIAWATTWRAVHDGRNRLPAAVTVAFTVATHLTTGYLALISVGVIVLAAPSLRAVRRGAVVLFGSVIIASWVLVPLWMDRHYSAQSEFYVGTIFNDSYGARKILRWLFDGSIFDNGRLPVISSLATVGLVMCFRNWRSDSRYRAIVLLLVSSLILYFGRATWGHLTVLLPGNGDLQMHRFIAGVHLSGILLAGIGLATCARLLSHTVECVARKAPFPLSARLSTVAAVLVCLLLILPAVLNRTAYAHNDAKYITNQAVLDANDGADLDRLMDEISKRNDGRAYSGLRSNWGASYLVGYVPVLQQYSHRNIDAIGFTFRTVQSLSTDIEVGFDETNLAQYEMLNVRYLILPGGRAPMITATLLMTSGQHRLYEVPTRGYIDVVDRFGSIKSGRANLGSTTNSFRSSRDALSGLYPGVAFDGGQSQPDTVTEVPSSRPGQVIAQSHEKEVGIFSADVTLDRAGVVLLKASFDPRWKVTVDGKTRPARMMAPSFVGVDVGPGSHEVTFTYKTFPHYPLLLTLGVTCGMSIWFFDRRRTRLGSAL